MDGASAAPQPLSRPIAVTVAEFLVVAICTLAFAFTAFGILHSLLQKNAAGQRDFVEYWSAGQLLAQHQDPYSPTLLLPIERSVGLPADQLPMIMGNAPPAIVLVLPLGYLPAMRAELVWCLFLIACLALSINLTRRIHGHPQNLLHLLAYSFGPALCCILAGQMSMLVLLGLALFLYLQRSRPVWAGASLWLCLLKPQLFLPFGIVLLAWAVSARRYRVIAGTVIAITASALAVLRIDPAAWSQYHHMMGLVRYDRGALPSIPNLLRRSIAPNAIWIEYAPAAAACAWALDYYRRNRDGWDWLEHGSLLMLISLAVAPYTWMTDQAVLIPALLHGLYITRSRVWIAVLALASAIVQLSIFGGGTWSLHSPWFLWTAPFWLAWYLLATRVSRSAPAQATASAT